MKKISIVTPCYFNELNIAETYKVIHDEVFSKCNDYDFEWVCVDDGSGDNTLNELKKVQEIDKRVKIVKLSRNFGEFRAIVAGLSVALGDAIVVISADLQDPPELIPDLIKMWENGSLVNLAVRKDRDENFLKNFFADTYYKLVRRWVIKDYPKRGFDFFLIDKKVSKQLVDMQEKNSSIYLQLMWLGYKPETIEYTRRHRDKGKSMWTLGKKLNLFIDTFVVFSHTLIRFIISIGFIFSVLGLFLAIYFVYDKLNRNVLEGWTSLAVLLLIVSGIMMVMMGILGEYTWRNLDETRRRPLYVIEEVIEKK